MFESADTACTQVRRLLHQALGSARTGRGVLMLLDRLSMQGELTLPDLATAGGDDDAFYSPKSNGSFTSDASFSSAAEYLGRSPSEELEGSQNAGGADIDREGSGALAQVPLPSLHETPDQALESRIWQHESCCVVPEEDDQGSSK